MLTLGAHLSVAKGLGKAVETAAAIGADTLQFFSRNPRGSSFRDPAPAEREAFFRLREALGIGPLLAHAPYTLNLASPKAEVYEFACQVIREDIARMDALGIEALVFHPGSHTGAGAAEGIRRITEGLNQALTGAEHITVLLETMTGKGTEIGSRFEELKAIREGLTHPERVAVCLDTCHVFSAGYDIAGDPDRVFAEFDRVLGLDLLRAVHFNDSLTPFGAHKDRHAVIGGGQMGREALLRLLVHPVLKALPLYLETPLDDAGHREELRMLRESTGTGQP